MTTLTCDRPLAIDLYAGLGGWTDGLLAEGWDVIGFDNVRHVYGEHRYPAQLVSTAGAVRNSCISFASSTGFPVPAILQA